MIGITSQELDLLPYTNFNLVSPIEMIEQYNITPLTDNYRRLTSIKSAKNFIYRPYIPDDIQRYNGREHIHIKEILLFMIREHELGHHNTISDEIIQHIQSTINTFSLLLFFDNYLKPTVLTNNIVEAIYTNFTLESLRNKMKTYSVYPDILSMYEDNNVDMEYIKNIFTLPQECIIQPTYSYNTKYIQVEIRTPFQDNIKVHNNIEYDAYEPKQLLQLLLRNTYLFSINDLLVSYAQNMVTSKFWNEFRELLYQELKEITYYLNLIIMLRNTIDIPTIDTKKKVFPILFIDSSNQHKRIQIGTDLKILATDTIEHKQYLERFFHDYNIKCRIILFDSLS